MFQKYEDWKDKDDESSGSFDRFLDKFDSQYAPHFETIHQDILTEHFIPGQMGIRRQLQQNHTARLNKNYRDKAYATKQGELYQILQSYDEDLVKEMMKDTDMPMSQLINRGRDNNDVTMGQLDLMKNIMGNNKAITKEQEEQLSQFPIGRKLIEDLRKLKSTKIDSSKKDSSFVSGKDNTKAKEKLKERGRLIKEETKFEKDQRKISTLGRDILRIVDKDR